MVIAICRFSASFSFRYDVTGSMLQDNEKMKMQYLRGVFKYLSKNEAKILQNGDVYLAQIPDFEMGYLESHLAH